MTHKHWTDNFSWTILKLRIILKYNMDKIQVAIWTAGCEYFLSISILLNILISMAWSYFALFHKDCWRHTCGSYPVCPQPSFLGKSLCGWQQLSLQLQLYLFSQPNLLAVMSIMFDYRHEKPLYTFVTLSGVRWRCRLTKTTLNRKS